MIHEPQPDRAGESETVRHLLQEASEASAVSEEFDDFSPLEKPEAALSEDQRQHLQPLGRFASLLARSVFAVNRLLMRFVFRLEVRGQDNLSDGPFVIAPNHVSYLDPPAVAAALPWQRLRETYWGGWTGTMFTNFLMRWLSRLTHVVPVDPQRGAMSSLAFAAAVLDRNHSLVWFPEGERSTDGKLQPFRPGIGMLMELRSEQVVPTAIEGAFEAFPPGGWLPRPHKIRITFGQPLDVDALIESDDDSEIHQQIAAALREHVAALSTVKHEGEGGTR